MIEYKGFLFASAPATGITWFLRACQFAGVGPGFWNKAIVPFQDRDDKLKVSLVRHPVTWLWDIYGSRITTLNGFSRMIAQSVSFESFVKQYMREAPGSIENEMMKQFNADSYLRCEDFPWAFLELARSVGVDRCLLDNQFFRQRPIINEPPQISSALRSQIVQSEMGLCEHFDYY